MSHSASPRTIFCVGTRIYTSKQMVVLSKASLIIKDSFN
jgi:hypothetical protein